MPLFLWQITSLGSQWIAKINVELYSIPATPRDSDVVPNVRGVLLTAPSENDDHGDKENTFEKFELQLRYGVALVAAVLAVSE